MVTGVMYVTSKALKKPFRAKQNKTHLEMTDIKITIAMPLVFIFS